SRREEPLWPWCPLWLRIISWFRGSEARDRRARLAHRALRRLVVLRRAILRQGDVRHVEVDNRLAAIVDLDRRDHRSPGLPDERRAFRERLPRIAHIVGQQHALA